MKFKSINNNLLFAIKISQINGYNAKYDIERNRRMKIKVVN